MRFGGLWLDSVAALLGLALSARSLARCPAQVYIHTTVRNRPKIYTRSRYICPLDCAALQCAAPSSRGTSRTDRRAFFNITPSPLSPFSRTIQTTRSKTDHTSCTASSPLGEETSSTAARSLAQAQDHHARTASSFSLSTSNLLLCGTDASCGVTRACGFLALLQAISDLPFSLELFGGRTRVFGDTIWGVARYLDLAY